MANTPFKLKSGNTIPFKQMGSSPVKDGIKHFTLAERPGKTSAPLRQEFKKESPKTEEGFDWSSLRADRVFPSLYGKTKVDKSTKADAPVTPPPKTPPPKKDPKTGQTKNWIPKKTEAATTPKKTTPKKGKGKSYADAHAKRDMDLYGDLDLAAYTTEAKRQTASKAAGKGWDAPTKPMKGKSTKTTYTTSGDGIKGKSEGSSPHIGPVENLDSNVEPFKPLITSRGDLQQEKLARKSSGRLNRKEIKYEKLASKAETALAEGKGRRAKRLARRADRKLRKKGVRTSDEFVGKTSDRLLDLGL